MQKIDKILDNGADILEDGKEILENTKEIIDTRKELIEDLFERSESYIKTNVELIKLKAVDKTADIVSALVANGAMVIFGLFFFMMLNVGIAIWLGKVMGQSHYGFMVVAGFYAIITLLVFMLRKNIKTPISNSIISQMLK